MTRQEEKREDRKRRLAGDTGEPSLGRWVVYYGTIMSGLLVIAGLLLAVYEVIFQPNILPPGLNAIPFHSNVGMPIVAAGVGIYTSGAISKAWQTQAEAKKMAASAPTNLSVSGGQNVGTSDPVNN